MAKKKADKEKKIPVNELEVGGVYKSYVNDVVTIEKMDDKREEIVLYNSSGAHRQWVAYKHIFLKERIR